VIASTTTIEIEEVILEELLIITEEVVQITNKIKKVVMKMTFLKVQLSQEIKEKTEITKITEEDVTIAVVIIIMTKTNGSKRILRKK
jgi:hypothetical protein